MACLGPESSPLRKNGMDFLTLLQKTSEDKVAPVGYRAHGCKSSSASAVDLRCFEMENEKEGSSSPRGVLEAFIRGLDTEAGSPSTDVSTPKTSSSNSNSHCRWQVFFKLWKKSSIKRLPSFPPLAVPKISSRKSRSMREDVDAHLSYFKSSWKNFTFSDLKIATNNFGHENLIGKGGHAEVYKGCLPDGQLVAIKRLNKGTTEEQTTGFLSEIGIIAHVNHPNTAKLIGFGVEGGTYLVLELSPLGSLGSFLRGSKEKLHWAVRYKIVLGIAAGLVYLHENCRRRIIHRDIKADNILLTENFEPQAKEVEGETLFQYLTDDPPAKTNSTYKTWVAENGHIRSDTILFEKVKVYKICDFGLAKWLPKDWTHHHVPKSEGTFGYFAPEYFMHGIVDEKTDVYSFGVLLLELITGREALDDSNQSLVLWAKPLIDDNSVKKLVDPSLGDAYNPEEMDRVILTSSLCTEQTPILRPQMSQVVTLLRGENYPECSKECQKRSLQRTFSEEIFDAEEYNSTKYFSDLNRHKEVALGS